MISRGLGAARSDLVEFLRLDQDVFRAGVVALDDVAEVDLFAGPFVDPSVADPVGGAAHGPRRTVVGQMVWDLEELAAARRDHGPEAVLHLLGQDHLAPTPAQPPGRQRTLANGTTGARLHPYADLQPAGTRAADLTSLGYTSPGSPG
ncbi:hypothetical protein ACVWXB_000008 [Streptomyces sp. TE12347]